MLSARIPSTSFFARQMYVQRCVAHCCSLHEMLLISAIDRYVLLFFLSSLVICVILSFISAFILPDLFLICTIVQGMHELLAPIHLLCSQHSLNEEEAAEVDRLCAAAGCTSFAPLLAREHVEADAFTAFRNLMAIVGEWFIAQNDRNTVVERCERIQGSVLRSKDPELAGYLASLHVLPQLYMLRWLRCLFGREFHLEDTMRVWDALFAFEKPLALVDMMVNYYIFFFLFFRSFVLKIN